MSAELEAPGVQPGLHHGIRYEDYARWPGVRHSTLRHFSRTPAHARHEMLNPKESTEAKERGHVCHLAVLEPERFDTEFVVAPKFDKRYTEQKKAWVDWQAANMGRTPILQDEYDLARSVRDAVYRHATARELLAGQGFTEVSAVWIDPTVGATCKARLDRLTALAGWSVIADFKSTRDASRRSFERDVYTYRYYTQAAMYLDGCNALAPRDRRFMFVCAETEPPYAVAVYELDQEAVELGRDDYQKWLATYAECMSSGVWPAFGEGADLVSVPAWAFRSIE